MYYLVIICDKIEIKLIHVRKETVNILPVVPVCSSGNICGHQEWDTREQRPYEPSSGASLL